ncbi:hypothetical protein, partial [Fulvivirga kasyanovii]|uniref:hypothetical protein n=1 Tax=Fulvivirga kasyanovii TaxID=396812 RepID=UPI001C86F080
MKVYTMRGFYFNSSQVRLKDTGQMADRCQLPHFNSSQVRLKGTQMMLKHSPCTYFNSSQVQSLSSPSREMP